MLFKVVLVGDGSETCTAAAEPGAPLSASPCGDPRCPACLVREVVERMRAQSMLDHPWAGCTITYEPGQKQEVIDDLVLAVREKVGGRERDRSAEVAATASAATVAEAGE